MSPRWRRRGERSNREDEYDDDDHRRGMGVRGGRESPGPVIFVGRGEEMVYHAATSAWGRKPTKGGSHRYAIVPVVVTRRASPTSLVSSNICQTKEQGGRRQGKFPLTCLL